MTCLPTCHPYSPGATLIIHDPNCTNVHWGAASTASAEIYVSVEANHVRVLRGPGPHCDTCRCPT